MGGGSPTVTLTASDVEIGAVEIKNSTDDTRAIVTTAAPGVGDPGLVVRIAGGSSSGGDGALLDGVNPLIRASVLDLPNSNPLTTQLVDANGDPVTTLPVSAASLPLPTGAATEATLATRASQATLATRASEATLASIDGKIVAVDTDNVTVVGTVAVSAASLPLPTGAATETTLAALNAKVTAVNTGAVTISAALPAGNNNIGDVDVASVPAPLNVTGGGTEAAALRVTVANDSTGLLSVDDNGSSLTVDTTQLPAALVVGRLDINIGASSATVPISAASLPLPTNAAQEHTTAASPHSTRLSDGAAFYDATKTGQLPAALISGRLDVNVGAALPAGTNNIGDVDVLTLPAIPAGNNNIGDVDIASAIPAGNNNIGDVDVASVPAPLNVTGGGTEAAALRVTIANNSTGLLPVNIAPQTTGGFSTFHLVSSATTNATNIKNSAGQVFGWYIYNNNASARKVAFHNTAGTPSAGSGVIFALVIPANSGANVFNAIGIPFATGIAITTVTDIADAGTTAVAVDDLNINIWYK
jgi:hypothetical protein